MLKTIDILLYICYNKVSNEREVKAMHNVTPEKIFIIYDNGEVICATNNMDEAVKLAIRYMYAQDYTIDKFSYGEDFTRIEYAKIYRIGAEIHEDEGSIGITTMKFYKSE